MLTRIDIFGTEPKQVVEELELYLEHDIGEYFFATGTPSPGAPIMFQLLDCHQLSGQYINVLMKMEICYRDFLYEFQEIRFDVPGTDYRDFRQDRTPHIVVMFKQKTMLM